MEKVGVFFILLIAIALSGPVFAEINPNPNLQGTLSMGIAIPAGITVKYWPNSTNAFDFKSSWSTDDKKSRICVDYLWHNFNFFSRPEFQNQNLAFYYGLGAKFCSGKKEEVGLRVVFGINYFFKEIPFDFFCEISPTLQLSPETNLNVDPGIGIRYLFH